MKQKDYETINQVELNRRMSRERPENADPEKGFALVNVLSEDDFAKAHIPASINIPIGEEGEFDKRYAKDKEIIVYCASSDCDASPKVAERLSDMGFSNVYDYEPGMREWKRLGGPVETGLAGQ